MNQYIKSFISFIVIIVILTNSFWFCVSFIDAKEIDKPSIAEKQKVKGEPEVEIEEEPVVEEEIIEPEIVEEPEPDPLACIPPTHEYTRCLTKRGGVYQNPYTGLKETWYSQRVLPGGGLRIPGRHVNNEGFVCDIDGYICLASSTYAKGTIIETSRGMGKVYDCGCAPGIIDLYVDW